MAHYMSNHIAVAYGDIFGEMVALSRRRDEGPGALARLEPIRNQKRLMGHGSWSNAVGGTGCDGRETPHPSTVFHPT